MIDEHDILTVLDGASANYAFPMLDNGYVYLAASRLALYRSESGWGLTIEIFGFSPREGVPSTSISTYARGFGERPVQPGYTSLTWADYLRRNPHNDFRSIWALSEGWQDAENDELVDKDASWLELRGEKIQLPDPPEYARAGVMLEDPPRIHVYELCRWLAHTRREQVLATEVERRSVLAADMRLLMTLDEWRHPDLARGEVPSNSETFRQLARALATGDVSAYAPTCEPNNHWKFWPEGGRL